MPCNKIFSHPRRVVKRKNIDCASSAWRRAGHPECKGLFLLLFAFSMSIAYFFLTERVASRRLYGSPKTMLVGCLLAESAPLIGAIAGGFTYAITMVRVCERVFSDRLSGVYAFDESAFRKAAETGC
jgi:hypothetical protein